LLSPSRDSPTFIRRDTYLLERYVRELLSPVRFTNCQQFHTYWLLLRSLLYMVVHHDEEKSKLGWK
jgi:hypothetical protein